MNALFNSKILGMFVFLLALSNKALGAEQNINFDDLQRAGAELFKTITITGIAQAGDSQIRQFSEVDQARREELRRNQGSYSSGRSSGTRGGASTSDTHSKASSWRCEFLCGKTTHAVTLNASDNYNAQNLALQYAKENCWALSRELYEAMWGRLARCSKQ